jgi:uncharacterized GH25 family protein
MAPAPPALVAFALVLAALALLAAVPARGHDFWIEPSTYRPAPGQLVTLRHRVGQSFLGDPVPRDPELLLRFVTVGSDGEQRVPGVDGVDPAGLARAPEQGTLVVGYESRGSLVELDAGKLALYADQEGVGRQLPAGWQSRTIMKDRFARSVKSLLVPAGASSAGFDRVIGLPLELVPLADPASLVAGGPLPLRLLWKGRPAVNMQVTALSRLDPAHPIAARTGGDGRVELVLPRGGEWLVKAVKILPASDRTVDFESVWSSLTFRTGGTADGAIGSR